MHKRIDRRIWSMCLVILLTLLTSPLLNNVQSQSASELADVESVASMAWNSDGSTLAISGLLNEAQGLWFYNANSGTIACGIETHLPQRNIAWSPDDTMVVGTSSNELGRTYRVFRVADGSIISEFETAPLDMPIHWSSDSTLIMVGGLTGINLHNAVDGSIERELLLPNYLALGSAVFTTAWDISSARAYGVYGYNDVLVWNSENAELLNYVQFPSSIAFPIALNAAGNKLAVQGLEGEILLIDPFMLEILDRMQSPNHAVVRDIVWHEDNIHLATFGFDRTIRIWDTEIGAQIDSIVVGELISEAPVWRPNSNQLVYSSVDASPFIVEITIPSSSTNTPTDTISFDEGCGRNGLRPYR